MLQLIDICNNFHFSNSRSQRTNLKPPSQRPLQKMKNACVRNERKSDAVLRYKRSQSSALRAHRIVNFISISFPMTIDEALQCRLIGRYNSNLVAHMHGCRGARTLAIVGKFAKLSTHDSEPVKNYWSIVRSRSEFQYRFRFEFCRAIINEPMYIGNHFITNMYDHEPIKMRAGTAMLTAVPGEECSTSLLLRSLRRTRNLRTYLPQACEILHRRVRIAAGTYTSTMTTSV